MKHYIILFTFSILFSTVSFGQSNYKNGYIINLKGDTVKGLVDYREWNKNPKAISFKVNLTDPATEYAPSTILFFAVNGFEYYKSAFVKVSQGEVETSRLALEVDSTYTIDSVFLKVVSSSIKVTLYSYKDVRKERFYIGEGNDEPTELIYNAYFNFDRTRKLTQDTYKRQLQKIAATYQPGNSKLLEDIQMANYSETDLKNIMVKINNSAVNKYAIAKSTGLRFYAGAGISAGSIKAYGNIEYVNGTYESSVMPRVAAGLDVFLNKNVGSLVFRTEVFFTTSKAALSVDGVANTPYTRTLKFDQYIIGLNPQVLYNVYNANNLKVYFTLGAIINNAMYKNTKVHTTYFVGSDKVESDAIASPELRKLFVNLSGRVGVSINNKFDIFAGYFPATPVNTGSGYALKYRAVHAGINYLFGKN